MNNVPDISREATDIALLRNALTNPSPAMRHFSTEELYKLVGRDGFDEQLKAAIRKAFDKERASAV